MNPIQATLTIITLSTLAFSGMGQPAEEPKEFTPEIKISSNLTTILPQIGVMLEDKGENISSYVVDKISKGQIHLNNNINIGLCGETTYIIGVGINNYKNAPHLQYAISDTEKIVNKVEENCKKTQTYVLKNASQNKILQTLENISKKVTKKDNIVFNFSGHGVRYKEKDYLLTAEAKTTKASALQYTALTLQAVEDNMKEMPIKNAIMIIDASRSRPYFAQP